MKITIIQTGAVQYYKNEYYRTNITDFIKYNKMEGDITYLAPFQYLTVKEDKYQKIDFPKINFLELPIYNKKSLLFLSKLVKDTLLEVIKNSDLVIVKLPSLAIGSFVVSKCIDMGKKVVVEVVGCAWDSYWYHSIKGKLLAPINYYLTKKAIKNSPFAVYVTQTFLQNRYPNFGVNIGCSNVNLSTFSDQPKVWLISSLKESTIKIGTISPIDVKFRAQADVIKALSILKKQQYKFKYYLIGGGDPTKLKVLAKKNNLLNDIVFVGKLPHNLVCDYIDNLDLYVHPSKAEGLPRSLVEAMSRGIPSIAANTAGNSELLDSRYLYPKGNFRKLANIIRKISPIELGVMSKENIKKSQNYAISVLDKKRYDFFKNITV